MRLWVSCPAGPGKDDHSDPVRLHSTTSGRRGSAKEDTVRHAIETVLLLAIGRVNQAMFWATRGRVVLYRFYGRPDVLLTVTGPDAPAGEVMGVGYLPDGDDYIVLATDAETGERAALRTATAATAELTPDQHVAVDITMLTDDAERAVLLDRLLRRASLDERHEVVRRREFPIARLTPHHKAAHAGSVAFSGIWLS